MIQNIKLNYSIRAAVEATSFSRSYIYKCIASGKLKPYRVGGRVYILRGELERFVNAEAERGCSHE